MTDYRRCVPSVLAICVSITVLQDQLEKQVFSYKSSRLDHASKHPTNLIISNDLQAVNTNIWSPFFLFILILTPSPNHKVMHQLMGHRTCTWLIMLQGNSKHDYAYINGKPIISPLIPQQMNLQNIQQFRIWGRPYDGTLGAIYTWIKEIIHSQTLLSWHQFKQYYGFSVRYTMGTS
jgi:hypothetical protein